MNNLKLLFSLICCLLWFSGYSTETEPNNSRTQANTLALNGSNSGSISPAGDQDWWKITITSDGKLDVTLTSTNGVYTSMQLYDNNGTTIVNNTVNYIAGTLTQSTDGLAKGTYYLKVYATNSNEQPTYTVSDALTPAPVANDVEPNGTAATAIVLAQNSSLTGHVGYYYNLVRDTADWYKVTTTGDGQLNLTLTSNNGTYTSLYLFDNNGTTLLNHFDYNPGTNTLATNGLATGTYYFKIYCTNYLSEFAPYTIKDTVINAPVSNDVEPDNSKLQALTISPGATKTGHVGYYYNLTRDTTDWYKVTISKDGQLNLTLTSNNGTYTSLYLYDKNGTTLLNHFDYNPSTNTLSTNGVAAGTYYFKIYCTNYLSEFSPYTLTATLTQATGLNDAEPNGSKALAQTLALNGSTTGHVGYYYNLVRDTADWYKITTTVDGELNLTLTNNDLKYMSINLYDNNGTTLINHVDYEAATSYTLVTDGLKAGTYFVKIYCTNYLSEFDTYTLANTLGTYAYAVDAEPNNYAGKAKTTPANGTVTGHINFYYNGAYDNEDWWKVNYTGTSGDLKLKFTEANDLACNCQHYFSFTVYGDTDAASIYNADFQVNSLTVNLSSLAQGYYYIRVRSTNLNEFFTYSLVDSFVQVNKAKITLQTATTGTDCSNGSLTYKCTLSHAPYTVQLFRYGVKYGNSMVVGNTAPFTISSLPPGKYYATAYGDGATGAAKGTSAQSTLVPTPTNATTIQIKKNKATLKWDSLACIKYDSIYYRVQGSGTWTKVKTANNHGSYPLTGLTASTTYEWQVAHVDTGNSQSATSSYTSIVTFTTLAAKMGEGDELSTSDAMNVYPNPTSGSVHVSFENANGGEAIIRLIDVTGKVVSMKHEQFAGGMAETDLDLASLSAGIYQLQIIRADGQILNKQVIKSRD